MYWVAADMIQFEQQVIRANTATLCLQAASGHMTARNDTLVVVSAP